jgi:uncharacterized protein YlaI
MPRRRKLLLCDMCDTEHPHTAMTHSPVLIKGRPTRVAMCPECYERLSALMLQDMQQRNFLANWQGRGDRYDA